MPFGGYFMQGCAERSRLVPALAGGMEMVSHGREAYP
ncbi:hypothetical protein FOVG_19991, partial [Fusarium oxysporum f. sp. pisi HDV247]